MDSLLNTYLTLLKQSENDPLYDSMVFKHETTTKDSFRYGLITDIKPTVYEQTKPTCLRIRPPPLKYLHTMTGWKSSSPLPSEFFIKPKEIVRTDPRQIQKPYVEPEDLMKEQVRATRPRLAMVPAVNTDNISDKRTQELLINSIYASSAKSAMVSGIASKEKSDSMRTPLQGTLSPANVMGLDKLKYRVPYVSPEWRMDSVSWDSRQLRGHCDHARDFFLARTIQCKVCAETAARRSAKKMKNINRA